MAFTKDRGDLMLKVQTEDGIWTCADPRALRSCILLMDMDATLGGAASHWGGPSALAEIVSAFHALVLQIQIQVGQSWKEHFHLINDAGHCENILYAAKALYGLDGVNLEELRGFRSLGSRLTGHGEAHLFTGGVTLSNGPLGSAFPQSVGLAFADRLHGKDRLTVTILSDGGCMEGEAREALATVPGFSRTGRLAPYVLVISDNNTKLSGRIDSESFSMQPTFQSLTDLGWKVMDLESPHDLPACLRVLTQAFAQARSNPREPIAIHARTVKGYGLRKTESSSSGGHGFPFKAPSEVREAITEIYQGEAYPQVFEDWLKALEDRAKVKVPSVSYSSTSRAEKVQVGVSRALIELKQAGLPIFSVSADLPGSTGVAEFQKQYPDATQDVGVAEAQMISLAAGLSKSGLIPVVDTFSQFGVTKGALPLTMANLSLAPVVAIFSHAGFQDAADGASHQALSYLSMMSSLPHTEVYTLSCSDEAYELVKQGIQKFWQVRKSGGTPTSLIYFLGRENFPSQFAASVSFQLGRAQVVHSGASSQCVLVSCGPLVWECLEAVKILKSVEVTVIHHSCVNQPDVKTVGEALKRSGGRLLTVEDHQVIGGMGSMLTHALKQDGQEFQLRSLGVRGEFGQSAYQALDLYRKHGLDREAIAQAVRQLIGDA